MVCAASGTRHDDALWRGFLRSSLAYGGKITDYSHFYSMLVRPRQYFTRPRAA